MTRSARQISITGLGAVSAWGWGTAPLWEGLCSGRTAIRPFDRFPAAEQRTHLAAQAPPPPDCLADALTRWADSAGSAGWDEGSLADRFALAAAREALAGAHPLPPDATGVYFGGSTAGMFESEEVFDRLLRGDADVDLAPLVSQPLDNPAAAVARALGVRGPVVTVSSACASGTQALGLALDALRAGEVEVALVGGADSLCRLTYSGFNALRVVDPEACRPFRDGRAGMSLGEGAGILVLETEERIAERRRRGEAVRVRALLRGVGNSCDAHHMTAPRPDGLGAALATRRALADAGADPDDVVFLNAHGTGTPLNDASEWRGFAQVFGPRAPSLLLTATKASVGHLLGSSGALEAVATVLCLENGVVHPTPGDGAIDPETPAGLVRGAPAPLPRLDSDLHAGRHLAVSTSFGFGGANAAAVFQAPMGAAAGGAGGEESA